MPATYQIRYQTKRLIFNREKASEMEALVTVKEQVPDCYRVLGVDKKASLEEIKKAYRNLSRKYHPDTVGANGNDAQAQEQQKEINLAWSILSDENKRAALDQALSNEATTFFSPAPAAAYGRPPTYSSRYYPPEYRSQTPPKPKDEFDGFVSFQALKEQVLNVGSLKEVPLPSYVDRLLEKKKISLSEHHELVHTIQRVNFRALMVRITTSIFARQLPESEGILYYYSVNKITEKQKDLLLQELKIKQEQFVKMRNSV